jgi:two-component system, LytTR family, response regulator
MNCIIIDDEPLARQGIINLLKSHKQIKIIAECKNVIELTQALQIAKPDVLFLDIEMPYLNGMSFLKKQDLQIPTIITTAYHQYAIEGYDLDVIDYLIKPIHQDRFDKAIQKLQDYVAFKSFSENNASFVFLKIDKQIEKIYFDEILFIEAMRNYIIIHTKERKRIHYSSITAIVNKLPTDSFLKVHKSFIVSLNKINQFIKNKVIINQHEIPVSKSMKKILIDAIQQK